MRSQPYDVIIIGAGVVGSMIARALSRFRLRLLLLDKASDVGEGTTKANTAIVHAGYDAKPGSLKARLNLTGNAMFDTLCHELQVDFDRCGSYVVAVSAEDMLVLDELVQRGRVNGVPGLRLLSGEEMRRREPAVTDRTCGALFSASGGIVDPFDLCIAAAENAVQNGAEVLLDTEVLNFLGEGPRISGVMTTQGPFSGRWVVNAAGLWADELRRKAGLDEFCVLPRKGEYFVLDHVAADLVHNVLFPCPTPVSKGILVTRTIHDNVMLGPNAVTIEDKTDVSTTASGLNEVMTGALKLVPGLDIRQIIRTFAGLRAGGNTGDFLIEQPREIPGLVSLAGIESPGLTASPAIGEYVVELLREAGLGLEPRADYDPVRPRIPRFSQLSRAAQEALIAQDPLYGNVVCRCETVTEAELVLACHRPIPARTYDALKRRTRLGSGRCQGAFDTPRAIQIMARELGISPLEVTRKGGDSRLLTRLTKEVAE